MFGRCQVKLKGAGLAVTSFSCLAGGLVILTAPARIDARRPVRAVFGALSTLETFAWVWILVGVLCAVAVFWIRARPMAFGLASALHLGWGFSYLVGWLLLPGMSRAWVTACIYLIIAALVVIVAGIREDIPEWGQQSSSR